MVVHHLHPLSMPEVSLKPVALAKVSAEVVDHKQSRVPQMLPAAQFLGFRDARLEHGDLSDPGGDSVPVVGHGASPQVFRDPLHGSLSDASLFPGQKMLEVAQFGRP